VVYDDKDDGWSCYWPFNFILPSPFLWIVHILIWSGKGICFVLKILTPNRRSTWWKAWSIH